MRVPLLARWSALVLLAFAQNALAGDLLLYVFQDGQPQQSVEVSVDEAAGVTNASGAVELTIDAGQHRVTLSREGALLHAFRFSTAPGQDADITVRLPVVGGEEPKVAVETYDSRETGPLEEVVAVASYVPDTALEQQRSAESVLDVIGREQLARFGDSNAADAVKRSSGVNVADGKFVFIRGLGGRYNTTTLNGASLPSTDPSRRTTPLDLFPSGILESVEVQKGFTPDLPGDSSAGSVRLTTRAIPDEDFVKISGSLGWNNRITGDDVLTDPADGDYDLLGFDDGSREMPALVEGLTAFGRVDVDEYNNYSPALVELMGQSFEHTLVPDEETALPNGSLGLSGGKRFTRGNNVYGIYATASYKNSWSVRDDGEQNSYGAASSGALIQRDDFGFFEATQNLDLGGMLSLGAELGLDHTLESTTLLSRKTENSVRVTEGLDGENNDQVRNTVIDYEERQFFSQQLSGEHFFADAGDLSTDWQYTFSRAERYAPDRRSLQENDDESRVEGQLVYNPANFERRYDELTDDNHDLAANLKFPLVNNAALSADLKAGLQLIRRERDAKSALFTYQWQGSITDEVDLINRDPLPDANEVYADENIDQDHYELRNLTNPTDRYDADFDLNAAYLMADADIGGSFRVIGGARVEQAEQTVNTFDNTGAPVPAGFDETDVMPSLNGTWFVTPDMQLRASYSRTVSRPDFKEMANALYFDPVFDFAVVGNPDLEISDVDNFDLRWEYYFSPSETLMVGVFYKDISSPIERILVPSGGSGGGVRTFDNADSGEIQGIEVDIRREFALDETYNQSIFVQSNAALIDSEVTLDTRGNLQDNKRKLQGQADYTFNLAVGYDHLNSGQKITLLFNRNGESIEDAGRGNLPDVIEEPVNQVDLTYEKAFSSELVVNLTAENLLDAEKEFTQGNQTYFKYKPGMTLKLGADWTF